MNDDSPHGSAYDSSHIVQIGNIQNVYPPIPEQTDQRQSLFFDVFRLIFKQAENTFRLSIIFMSGGGLLILAGGALTLIRSASYNPHYITTLATLGSGLLIGSSGGAFAVQSNRARKHLAEQARTVHADIRSDRAFSESLALIDRVDDPATRDRLNAAAALRVLGLDPDTDHATRPPLSIEPMNAEIESTDRSAGEE